MECILLNSFAGADHTGRIVQENNLVDLITAKLKNLLLRSSNGRAAGQQCRIYGFDSHTRVGYFDKCIAGGRANCKKETPSSNSA